MIEKDIIIIGAGLTGLTAAHHLQKLSADFCVLEQKDSYGGVIKTVKENGFIYEKGPNTGTLSTLETAELFDDLKDYCTLEVADKKASKRYILKDGKWHSLPAGILEGIKTELFTTKDKFNLLLEPFRKRGNNPHETLADLVKRRMGQSFLDYAIDPFVIGIYSGDPAYLVPKYAFPKLYNLEQEYGSFIGGAIKKSFKKKDEQAKRVSREIFSAQNGLSSLTDALYKSAKPENFHFKMLNIKVEHKQNKFIINAEQNGKNVQYICNKLITTIGSYGLKNMFPFIEEDDMLEMSKLYYPKMVGASIGFHKWQGMDLDAFGGLIPFKEDRNVLGYLFISSFLKNRAPKGGALMTCFAGGVRKGYLYDLPDAEIKQVIADETTQLLGLKDFKPELFEITRYPKAIPQYGADSGKRYDTVNRIQSKFTGLLLGGNLRDGIGVADRIKQGANLAKQVLSI